MYISKTYLLLQTETVRNSSELNWNTSLGRVNKFGSNSWLLKPTKISQNLILRLSHSAKLITAYYSSFQFVDLMDTEQ